MNKIIYNPMTMIMLHLEPSIGLVGNWSEWSNVEDEIIKLGIDSQEKLTLINIVVDDRLKVISENAIISQMEKYGIHDFLTFIVPNFKNPDFWNFESFKSMLHFKKIIINVDHPFFDAIQQTMTKTKMLPVTLLKTADSLFSKAQTLLKNGEIKGYQSLTGANYNFSGFVVKGQQLGRTINFPTANIQKGEMPFKQGVYLTKVKLPNDENTYWGMADYWCHPSKGLTFEVHILDFDKDIYGWNIQIELIDFERENIKVENLEQLKALLISDKQKMIAKIKKEQ
ncbi:riboflavin kinase/FAD synthetase [Williamsoniiplasma luminosum]|uniref:riboflavin kinase n=1 Tax=Williamsoniiplasma luminosum TaxID=214888 RepID=A0A2K8NU13_9MOLU|nr:riboflavin kinase [Williamsoniiplasma luminosum]ATZ17332.1 riboflavin kinase/FAD synthetase [Williamsoniiplasma luminosum]